MKQYGKKVFNFFFFFLFSFSNRNTKTCQIANVIKAVENPSDRREAMQKLCMPLAAAVEDPAASLTTIGYAFNLICSAFKYGSKHFVKRRGGNKNEMILCTIVVDDDVDDDVFVVVVVVNSA